MRLLVMSAALVALAAALPQAQAHQIKAGSLVIHHPWTRATPSGAKIAVGYTVIENTGKTADRLIGGSFDAAGGFELHSMAVIEGVMTMRPVSGGIDIPPGGKVEFKPGGLHMMFTGLKHPLVKDEEEEGTLVFQQAGTVKVEFEVEAVGAKGPDHGEAPGGMADDMPGMDHMPGTGAAAPAAPAN